MSCQIMDIVFTDSQLMNIKDPNMFDPQCSTNNSSTVAASRTGPCPSGADFLSVWPSKYHRLVLSPS